MSHVRYAVLVAGEARRREDIADGREPRRDLLDIAHALGGPLIEGGWGWGRGAMRSGLRAAWTAFRRRSEYEVILADAERSGLPLALLFKLTGTRRGLIVIAHRLHPAKKRFLLQSLRAASAVDRFVVYGSYQERLVLERLRLPRRKIEMALPAADPDFWHPLGQPKSGICAAGLEWRDYRTLVEAVRGLDLNVTIAAASPWSTSGPFAGGLPPNVSNRRLDFHELRELYDRSEFVVVPLLDADFQAGSLVMYEAMAMGKALIVSRTRAHQDGDIVREGETGLLVPPGDVVALRQAIIRLHRDPAEAKRMGANARRVVEEGLNYDVYLRRMLQIANEVGAEMAAYRRAGQSNGSRPARVASGDAADEWRIRTGSR